MKKVAKWSSAAAVLGGVLVLTGCQSSKVMDNRPYIPAASGDEVPAVVQTPAPMTDVKELPIAPVPEAAPAAPVTYPTFDAVAYPPAAPAKKPVAKGGVYVVKKGDTVSAIAYRHGVRTADMMAVNGLDEQAARRLKIGQKLTIPTGGKKVVSKKAAVKKSGNTAAKTVTATAAAADGTYTVRKGDNIPSIARKLGVKAKDLMAANNLDDAATRRLQIGQKLIVPGKGGAAAPAKAAETAKPAVTTPVTTTTPVAESVHSEEPVQAVVTTANTPAEAAVTENKVDDGKIPESHINQVAADISVRDYLKSKNLTWDEFKKLNDIAIPSFRPNGEDVLDSIIPAGTALFIPGAPPAAQ